MICRFSVSPEKTSSNLVRETAARVKYSAEVGIIIFRFYSIFVEFDGFLKLQKDDL